MQGGGNGVSYLDSSVRPHSPVSYALSPFMQVVQGKLAWRVKCWLNLFKHEQPACGH